MYKLTLIVVLVAIVQLAAGQVSLVIYSTADGNMASSMMDSTATVSQIMNMDASSQAVLTTSSYMSSAPSMTHTISATATSSAVMPTATSAPPAWQTWGAWINSACSTPCGNGTLSRVRQRCQVVNTNVCENDPQQNVFCIGTACNTTGTVTVTPTSTWAQWSAWVADACSVPCGNGTFGRIRKRCKVNDANNCENHQELNVFCVGPCTTANPTAGALYSASYSLPLVFALIFMSFTQYFF